METSTGGVGLATGHLAALAERTRDAVNERFLAATRAFDARAGVLCREVAARYLPDEGGAGVASQAAYLLSLVARIVAEDRSRAVPLDPPPGGFDDDPLFRMLERCARSLPAFVRGDRPGVDVIFPRGDLRLWAEVQGGSVHMNPYGRLVADAVDTLLPDGGRVLEIGAGSGSATAALLARRAGSGSGTYVVSDIGATFLRDARARFGTAGPRYAVHDFTRSPRDQELAGARFDIVFGANAMHCAADVGTALRHTLELVAPGGHLVLAEGARPADGRVWRPELVFAVLPGWWRVRTDPRFRPEVGFLRTGNWVDLLTGAGYAPVTVLPLGSASSAVIGSVIIAGRPDPS